MLLRLSVVFSVRGYYVFQCFSAQGYYVFHDFQFVAGKPCTGILRLSHLSVVEEELRRFILPHSELKDVKDVVCPHTSFNPKLKDVKDAWWPGTSGGPGLPHRGRWCVCARVARGSGSRGVLVMMLLQLQLPVECVLVCVVLVSRQVTEEISQVEI